MDYAGISGVAGITSICWLLGLGVKLSPLDNKYIPLFCGILGGCLGLLGLGCLPRFPAENALDAVSMGIASGLAATGADQAVRQLL